MECKLDYFALCFLILFLQSCGKDVDSLPIDCGTNTYLHIAHTRTDANPYLDPIVEQMDLTQFDMIWLGGDIAADTSEDDNTMEHIDELFDVSSENTLWALGNHDYSNIDRIQTFTKRPTYYSTHKEGVTIVVLDTQVSNSSILSAQKEMLFGVLDTIQASSHLIILHHKLIWMYDHHFLENQISSISNVGLGDCSYCLKPNNFNSEIYPKLVEIKENGTEVICIGGDIGNQVSRYSYRTVDGIHFLASGLKSGDKENKALIFCHDPIAKVLTWEFKLTTVL